MYYILHVIEADLKTYDCYVLFFLFEKSFKNILVEKWVTLEVQRWYNCKKLSKLDC